MYIFWIPYDSSSLLHSLGVPKSSDPQGALLLKRRIYKNTAGKAFVCLGFQTYAAIGFPLETKRVGDKDSFCYVCDTNQNMGRRKVVRPL